MTLIALLKSAPKAAGFAGTLTPAPSPTRTPATRERGAATQRLKIQEEGSPSPGLA